jgi:hypothetical protein
MALQILKRVGALLFGVPLSLGTLPKECPMYGEAELYRAQENDGYGCFLIETIAKALGVPPTEGDIKAAVYKHSASGTWIKFDEVGVVVGMILDCNGVQRTD